MIGTGGSGHFNCSVHGGRGGGLTLSWQHEGRPLHAPQSRLTLGPIRNHHGGLYQCTAHDHSESAVAGAELLIAGKIFFYECSLVFHTTEKRINSVLNYRSLNS